MRRLANLLWFTSALLVLLVGLAGAALSGPDDTVEVVSDKVGDARGVPLVTAPVLTDVTGLDLVVTAEASGGVFVGAAHRVDLDDLLDGAEHYRVTGLYPELAGGLVGGLREGSRFLRGTGVTVDELDVWRQRSAGTGPQQVTVPLTGESLGVLVVPSEAEASPTVSFGYHWQGLFTRSLRVALVGLLGLVLWGLHRARRGRPSGDTGDAGHGRSSGRARVPAQRRPQQTGPRVQRVGASSAGATTPRGRRPAVSA
ncbi:hypothetical protein IEQ44_08955 [Nocardioides sp. Y6]|uniref:DUF3153 domain-containing protein n=1 Tax=Nocardioides malaquae TaxID=2773426 RepID=A0ABR9RTB6_9ACTN|nr:hypothetical protein [Nocardioides malaquae]MBE7324781.1 hypothetical protein [Nocardioides malaquae]